jgi:hypothetical protein
MKRSTAFTLGWCLLLAALNIATAQEKSSGAMPPPKVLVVMREFVKPGKSGSPHSKTESAFVNAFAAAKWPTHYLGMDSLSGPSRSLFMTPYDSFADWEKDNQAIQNNATLSAAIDRAAVADGELLNSYDSGVFVYREDYSLHANVDIALMRYMEIARFQIRPGHEKDWAALVKLYMGGYEKIADSHWATYESMYGADNGGVYIVITPMKSAAEVDTGLSESKQFAAALGEDGMKKLSDLAAACIESSQTNLFQFNPKITYPSDRWIQSDPSFWKPAEK